eukprot:TRINITY_DN22961_c0_g2_i1.p1 TRINITY_DN22961_c0_g2~~TRINITY_DN22961_c0_g2_i1.p1  ORF type:complete len:433 (-),score=27.78 TRINITY_DN22961_c0_g2_i1:333-1553(-)
MLRRGLRVLWLFICAVTVILMPFLLWEYGDKSLPVKYELWLVAGIFVIMTVPVSVYEVAIHVEYYSRPTLQRHVIRILWMAPIYSLDSWFALRFPVARLYLDPLREVYEAYVIYNFYMYLIRFLEDETGDLQSYMATRPQQKHIWGVQLFAKNWPMDTIFLRKCKQGVLSYVILRPLLTLISFICYWFGAYNDGKFALNDAYGYVAVTNSIVQMWALYCLALFYHATHHELGPIQPLKKFVIIKLVVFASFWQGVALAVLAFMGVIRADNGWESYDTHEVAGSIQDFLICIEMFFAALGHAYAFPVRDYIDPNIPSRGFFANIKDMFDLRDVVVDVQGVVEDTYSETTTRIVDKFSTATNYASNMFRKTNHHELKDGDINQSLVEDYRQATWDTSSNGMSLALEER